MQNAASHRRSEGISRWVKSYHPFGGKALSRVAGVILAVAPVSTDGEEVPGAGHAPLVFLQTS